MQFHEGAVLWLKEGPSATLDILPLKRIFSLVIASERNPVVGNYRADVHVGRVSYHYTIRDRAD